MGRKQRAQHLDLRRSERDGRAVRAAGDPRARSSPARSVALRRSAAAARRRRRRSTRSAPADTTIIDNDIRFSGDGTMREQPVHAERRPAVARTRRWPAGGTKLALHARSGRHHARRVGHAARRDRDRRRRTSTSTVRGPNLARLFDFLGVAVPDTRALPLQLGADQGRRRVALHPPRRACSATATSPGG